MVTCAAGIKVPNHLFEDNLYMMGGYSDFSFAYSPDFSFISHSLVSDRGKWAALWNADPLPQLHLLSNTPEAKKQKFVPTTHTLGQIAIIQ